MFRPPTKYSEYLQDVRKSIDYILKRVNATTVTQIVAGTNVTISPASGTGVVTINASGGGGGGLPAGGTTGQILAKINNVDYNAEWIDNYALWTSTVKHEVKAGEAINKGQAVYVSSADGTNMIVSKASNASEATSSKTLGILAQSLAHNAKGFVITEGLLAGLDTSAAGAAGDPVWLGTDGNLLFGLANKPYAPANMVSIGVVTRKNSSNGEIFIRIQNGFELDELHNVDARNPNNNDGIFYNSTTQLWEHKPVSAVYATPTLAQVTTAGNTTTNAITVGGLVVDTNTLVVDAVNNRVGIGTTNPSTPLDVIGAGRFSGYVRSDFLNTHNNSKSIIGNPSNYTSIYDGSGIEAIRIVSNGNVLIGTTTDAGYKLDVNGTARVVNKTNIGSETVSQGSLYIGHNGTAGGSNGTATVFFVSQFGNYPYRLGAENNGYDFFLRQVNGGQGSVNIDFSGLNSISYNITNTNVLNQAFGKSAIVDAKTTLNSYLAIGTRFGYSDSTTAGDSPLIFFRSMGGSYFDKTVDAAVTIRNGLPTVADNNITKNTAYWYRNGYIGIGTSTTLSATNTLKGAITINQGTTIGYQNLTPGSLSSVITAGTSATVTFTPTNGNGVVGYGIIVGTIITANGVSRRVTAVNYQTVTVDSAVDWSAGYNYTYRNPYVSIADGSTPIFDILPSGNVAVGTTTALAKFTVAGSITAASALAQGVYFNNTLVAASNNDVLVGLDINPTFTNGAFTGLTGYGLRVKASLNTVNQTDYVASFENTHPLYGNGIQIIGAGDKGSARLLLRAGNNDGTDAFRVSGSGSIFVGTGNNANRGTVIDNNSISLGGYQTISNGNSIGIVFSPYSAANAVTFRQSGNVLIGTTTDSGYKLDVNGSVKIESSTLMKGGLSLNYTTPQFTVINAGSGNKAWSWIMSGNDLQIREDGIGFPMVFKPAGNIITNQNGGNFLIGTTTDAGYKLDVNGTGRFTNNLSITKSYNLTWGTNQQINVTDYPSYFSGGYNVMSFISTSSGSYADDGSFVWRNAGTSKNLMVLTGVGNLGIGTPTPTDKIHIVDNTNGNKFARISAGGTDASAAWVAQNDQVDNIVYRVFGSAVTGSQMGQALARSASLIVNLGGAGKFLIGSYSGTDLIFGTSDQARMRLVDATGNFLIGTMTDNGNKLTVSGNIDAQGYKVNNVLGYTGIFNVPTNPPGQQNIDIQGGIVVNIF